MSLRSSIFFYSKATHNQPAGLLVSLMRLLEPQSGVFAMRRSKLDDSWRQWQTAEEANSDIDQVGHLPSFDFVWLRVEPSAVAELYEFPKCLSLNFETRFDVYLKHAVLNGMSPSVYGDFAPYNFTFRIGCHDLWEHLENEEGLFYARPFLSFCFWGYSTPANGARFREEVFDLPEMRNVQQQLEAYTGPLEHCFYSSG